MILRVAVIAVLTATAGSFVQAAVWRIAPSFSTSVVGESNPRFLLATANDQQAIAADLGLNLERQTETTNLMLNSSAARRQYQEDRSLNRSDLRMNMSLQHAVTERFSWAAVASATRDTTLTSELGTSGETRVGDRHESAGAQLQPSWQLSERWSTTMLMQWQSDFYPSSNSALVDYRYLSAGLTNTWRRSEQDSIGVVLRASQLQVANSPANIHDASALLQYKRSISERWSLTLAAGPAWTRGARATESGENFSLDIARTALYGAVSLSVDRSIAPTGRGYLTRRDSLALQLRREFTEHLTGTMGARYLRSRNIAGALGFAFDDVRYSRAEAGLNWSASPQWSTDLRAGYSAQKQSFNGVLASGVDVALGIRWNGKNHVF